MNCWLRTIHSRTRASPRVPYSRSATIRYMVAFAVLSDACLPLARGSASQFPGCPRQKTTLFYRSVPDLRTSLCWGVLLIVPFCS